MKIKAKFLLLITIPLIFVGTTALIASITGVRIGLEKAVKNELHTAAVSCVQAYDYAQEGNYVRKANGVLMKGDFLGITNDFSIVDNLKATTNIDAALFFGSEQIVSSMMDKKGERLIASNASKEVTDVVIGKGKDYFSTSQVINGETYFAYYVPLINSDGTVIGMFFAGMPKSGATETIVSIARNILLIVTFILIISLIVSLLFVQSITKGLKRTVLSLETVASGQLNGETHQKDLLRKDEVGDISKSTEKLKRSLRNMIGQIMESTDILTGSTNQLETTAVQTSQTAEEVERAIEDISNGAMSQATETQEATTNIIIMGNLIEATVTDVEHLNQLADSMQSSGSEALEILEELHSTNEKTKDAIDIISAQTYNTNESAQKIQQATDLITSIAEETNLLSLNASIEAARAGEHGRGFAVVASQIQKLAEQSNSSARKIEQVISELLNDSKMAVETMEEVKTITEAQTKNVEMTKNKFIDVNSGIHTSIEGANGIAEKAKELDQTRKVVIDIVQSLTAVAEENAASTEETSASIEELESAMSEVAHSASTLKDLSKKLSNEVKAFKL